MEEETRKKVREGYAHIAVKQSPCCGSSEPSCGHVSEADKTGKRIGYTHEDLQSVPEGANMGLGCGNPVALASLKEGETVVDLGSGGGFDCFLAAKKVGKTGKIIGVDMTPEMIDKSRENARKDDYGNVEFRLGEIENLPVADNAADMVISNCVVNLSPNKKRVFEEAFRVLKPGGRLMVSDMVLLKELPDAVKERAHPASCVGGAMLKDKYLDTIRQAGFQDISIVEETRYSFEDVVNDPDAKVIVANPKKGSEELKRVSELDDEAKEIVKETLVSTASINVRAVKSPN